MANYSDEYKIRICWIFGIFGLCASFGCFLIGSISLYVFSGLFLTFSLALIGRGIYLQIAKQK